jgi:hypothetical protein
MNITLDKELIQKRIDFLLDQLNNSEYYGLGYDEGVTYRIELDVLNKIIADSKSLENKTIEEDSQMSEELAWDLAKKLFEKKMGYEPKIIQGNTTHEMMVACLQEGILEGAKYILKK